MSLQEAGFLSQWTALWIYSLDVCGVGEDNTSCWKCFLLQMLKLNNSWAKRNGTQLIGKSCCATPHAWFWMSLC